MDAPDHPRFRSALVLILSLRHFCRYFFTREGSRLSRLAFSSIVRDMASLWVGASLIRNFMKRIGSHLLLEKLRDEASDWDIIIWDEGSVHAAHNLFVHDGAKPKVEEILEFAHIVPKPDLLIWVTAPTAQLAKVLLERGHSRVCGTSDAAQAFAENARKTFEVLASVHGLKEKICRIDNSTSTTDQTETAIRERAGAIGKFLVRQLHEPQESLAMKGASICLTA